MEEIKRFRQIDSRTPESESHLTTGVETTTGRSPRRWNSVAWQLPQVAGGNFNRPGFDIFNSNVYAVCGDGDLMEGVAANGFARGPS